MRWGSRCPNLIFEQNWRQISNGNTFFVGASFNDLTLWCSIKPDNSSNKLFYWMIKPRLLEDSFFASTLLSSNWLDFVFVIFFGLLAMCELLLSWKVSKRSMIFLSLSHTHTHIHTWSLSPSPISFSVLPLFSWNDSTEKFLSLLSSDRETGDAAV